MLTIDGAYGEGGGQILRSAVSLSAITGKSIEVINIRAKRPNPGLRPQHLHASKALAEIFHARVDNLNVGAERIRFIPKPDKYEGGELKIDTGTAGSIPMILQTIIPAVALSGKSLSVQITSALLRLERHGVRCSVYSCSHESSLSPGGSILVYSDSDFGPFIGGESVGARDKSGEKVGEEAAQNFFESYDANIPIDRFLADMLVIPLSLTKGKSRYRIGKVTEHLKTNLHVVSQIVGCKYQIELAEKSYIV